jgi:DNA-binding GntR family transcriptional regulator
MLKYQKVTDLLKKCIQYGDYTVKDIPTERELAMRSRF